jgi:signal transduction histidine kinase
MATASPQTFAHFTAPLPEPHLLVSPSAQIEAANPAAREAFGLRESAPGIFSPASLIELVEDPAEKVMRLLRSLARTGHLVPVALTLRGSESGARYLCTGARNGGARGNGAPVEILLRFRLHQDAVQSFQTLNRQVDRLSRELHHRRRIEAELRTQAQQLREYALELEVQRGKAEAASRAKSEFLGGMSHELRTPLNAIIGYVDLLDAEISGPVTTKQREQLDRIRRGARHLVTFIAEILEFARMDSGAERLRPGPADLAAVAREALELIHPAAAEAGLELRHDLPDTPVRVHTDAPKLRQALLNLLSNAVRFTPAGRIDLALSWETGPEGRTDARFTIRDTGVGIDPADHERIFEPFWQVGESGRGRSGGIGLGLPVAREIARLLGGEIEMESIPGEGSAFTLTVRSLEGADG